MKRFAVFFFAALALLVCSPLALAWGPVGHRTVAALAESQIQPQTREAVDALLAVEPGATLVSIATWADETRSDATFAWHFVNFPRGDCHYDPPRDCKDGNCVVAALENQLGRLGDASLGKAERLESLKYVVHFAGDIHQPLHGSFGDDRGGNRYQLSIDGEGSNLHSLWDSGMIRLHGVDEARWATQLQAGPPPTVPATMDPADWAMEDCKIVSSSDFYPPHKLPDDYVETWFPTLETRVQLAGLRLAHLLDAALGAPAPAR